AEPELAEQVKRGEVSLRDAARVVQERETKGRFDNAVQRYPFLEGVPGLGEQQALDMAGTLDATDEAERAEKEDQARRWCEAQRTLVPRWRAEDEAVREIDGVIRHLAQVNVVLGRRSATDIAEVVLHRIA